MIRAVLVLVGLLLGGIVAVAQAGRVGHLGLIPGFAPPAWTARLTPDSGLTRGRSRGVSGADVAWQMAPLALAPPRWNVAARMPGGTAALRVTPGLDGAAITLRTATFDLGAAPLAGLSGSVLLTGGQAALPWASGRLSSLSAAGRILNLGFQGEALGAFDLTLDATLPVWRADLVSVAGNPVSARAIFEGLSGAAALQLTLSVDDTPDLPDGIRALLQRTASATPDGWETRQRLPLPRPLP